MNEINMPLCTHSYPAMLSHEPQVFCFCINASAICKTPVHSDVGLREHCLHSLFSHIV
jgi:hypothetical protein